MPVPVDLPIAEPLLDVAGEADADVRLTAVDTLTHLPLTERAWRALAERGRQLLRDLEAGSALSPRAFDVLGRIRVRSMRLALGGIAGDETRADSLACAIALARQRDPAGLDRILRAFGDEPTAPVAAAIASFPIERYSVNRAPFLSAMQSGDEMVRFWSALALARLGDTSAFKLLWRQLPSDPPPMFYGDPWTPYRALAETRPLPPPLRRLIVDTYKRAIARVKKEEGPDAQLPRDQYVLVGGLTGLLDPEGQQVEKRRPVDDPAPWRPDPEAARALLDRLRAIATQYTVLRVDYVSVTNATLDAVRESGGRVAPPIGEALTDPLVLTLPREALAWTLGRAGAVPVVEEAGPLIASASAGRQRELVELTREIVMNVDAGAPYAGAGAGGDASRPASVTIIDDSATEFVRLGEGSSKTTMPEPETAATTTAFPDIAVSNEHPVSGDEITIDVTLGATAADRTAGRVVLEGDDPARVYDLEVTLLFGDTLQRKPLRYSGNEGTTTPASFTVAAPETRGEARVAMPIRVNFYMNHRWCGEGTRTIEIRRDQSVPPGTTLPPPPPGGIDDHPPLHFEGDARPADLTVRIYRGATEREFVWECRSPHVPLALPDKPEHAVMRLDETAKDFVRRHFKPLASKPLTTLDVTDIEGIGEIIYTSAPPVFKDAYWKVWNASQGLFHFDSVQIVTDEPYVPWELMRIGDDERAPSVDAEFLGVRHSVGRWLASERARMRQRIGVATLAVSASDYECVEAIKQKLPWAGREKTFLLDTYHASVVPLTTSELLDFLHHGHAQAVHFACHGQMFIDDPLSSQLVCEDAPNVLKPTMVNRTEVRRGLGRQRPLVFLNACEVGSAAAALSLVAGFPGAFLDAGASALVSPLWVVNDERARTVSEAFYTEAFANRSQTLGAVMREIRGRWRDDHHLTFLAYVLYGDPLATVSYAAGT